MAHTGTMSIEGAKRMIKNHLAKVPRNLAFRDAFLSSVLEFHPDKKAHGHVALFYGRSDGNQFGTDTLQVIDPDGNRTPISWKACARGFAYKEDLMKVPEASRKRKRDYDLNIALRDAVNDTKRKRFLRSSGVGKDGKGICAHCDAFGAIEADHKNTPFCEIKTAFLAKFDVNTPIELVKSGVRYAIKRPEIRKAWVRYHDGVASFQLLCKSCNCRKGAK